MSKAILLSIKPEWLVKILNGEKTIEDRKKFPKDYVGWVYIYCTKEDNLCCIKRIDRDRYICGKDFDTRDFPHLSSGYEGKGKVVARFWCDKVEGISLWYSPARAYICCDYDVWYFETETLDEDDLLYRSCLSQENLANYLCRKDSNTGYAIHISNLEIFDRPRELSEFQLWCNNICTNCKHLKMFDQTLRCRKPMLIKAPQNYCYVEGEQL